MEKVPSQRDPLPTSTSASRFSDPRDRYSLGVQLGQGGYGVVVSALDVQTGRPVAVKIINLDDCASDDVSDVHTEINVMANSHCDQLTQYYTSFVTPNHELWIVMEYADAGSLLDLIKEFGPLEEKFMPYLMRELVLALQYLHSERKIHR
jgi:serine/threonine-protein kinase 24/25/MST4